MSAPGPPRGPLSGEGGACRCWPDCLASPRPAPPRLELSAPVVSVPSACVSVPVLLPLPLPVPVACGLRPEACSPPRFGATRRSGALCDCAPTSHQSRRAIPPSRPRPSPRRMQNPDRLPSSCRATRWTAAARSWHPVAPPHALACWLWWPPAVVAKQLQAIEAARHALSVIHSARWLHTSRSPSCTWRRQYKYRCPPDPRALRLRCIAEQHY